MLSYDYDCSLKCAFNFPHHFDNDAEVWPHFWILVPASLQYQLVLVGAIRRQFAHIRSSLLIDNSWHNLMRPETFEGRFSGHDLPHDNSKTINVSLVSVVSVTLQHFRGHPMESSCESCHSHSISSSWSYWIHLFFWSWQTKVRHFHLNVVRAWLYIFNEEQIERLEIPMQDLRFLYVQEIHSFCDVNCHSESLFHCQLNHFLFMQEWEKSTSKAEFS